MNIKTIALAAASASLVAFSAMAEPVALMDEQMDTVTAGSLELPNTNVIFVDNVPESGEPTGNGELLPLWNVFGGIGPHQTQGSVGAGNPICHNGC